MRIMKSSEMAGHPSRKKKRTRRDKDVELTAQMKNLIARETLNFEPEPRPLSRYQRYLQSAEWKIFRLSVIAKRGRYCQDCGSSRDVQLHHLTYERLGHERPEDVRLLCDTCHQIEHGILGSKPERVTSKSQKRLIKRPLGLPGRVR